MYLPSIQAPTISIRVSLRLYRIIAQKRFLFECLASPHEIIIEQIDSFDSKRKYVQRMFLSKGAMLNK